MCACESSCFWQSMSMDSVNHIMQRLRGFLLCVLRVNGFMRGNKDIRPTCDTTIVTHNEDVDPLGARPSDLAARVRTRCNVPAPGGCEIRTDVFGVGAAQVGGHANPVRSWSLRGALPGPRHLKQCRYREDLRHGWPRRCTAAISTPRHETQRSPRKRFSWADGPVPVRDRRTSGGASSAVRPQTRGRGRGWPPRGPRAGPAGAARRETAETATRTGPGPPVHLPPTGGAALRGTHARSCP